MQNAEMIINNRRCRSPVPIWPWSIVDFQLLMSHVYVLFASVTVIRDLTDGQT